MNRICILMLALIGMVGISSSIRAQHLTFDHAHFVPFGSGVNTALSLMQPQGAVSVVGRQQWAGLDGAPRAVWGQAHLGISRFGATSGVQFRQQSVGVERLTEASAFFAKSIRLSEQDYLGLSLQAGVIHMDANLSGLDDRDPAFRTDIKETDMLLGVGLVYYRPEVFYVGMSLPRLTQGGVGLFGDPNYHFDNHYHLTAGFLWPLGSAEEFHLRPSVLVSHASSFGTTLDGSVMVFAQRRFGLGVGARTQGDLSGKLQFRLSGLTVGYNYQFHPGNQALNRQINNSTHEIGLSYAFGSLAGLL